MTKPQIEATNKKIYLTKRNFHSFMNKMPAELPTAFKTQFYESYGLWLVAETSLPVVIVDITTDDLECFEQRNSFDMRQILFNAADKNEMEVAFTDHVKDFFEKNVKEF